MADNEFPIINTGNGIDRDLAATTNNRLELLVTDIRKLNQTISEANEKNDKLQNKVFWLTVVGVGIAAIQLIEVVDIVCRWFPK
ncbi:MAG: hypothetical protein MUD00_00910 [Candidatus Pacebacteria bacterium]|jgi:hypothetical protein|nr:hypothetical protein [Candidatus Paceibacterota bacterium]